jgi:hypothetical protein
LKELIESTKHMLSQRGTCKGKENICYCRGLTDVFLKKKIHILLVVIYTMEVYSATKKNEILSFTSKWMELENIILSKVSQAKKAKNRMFSLICGL